MKSTISIWKLKNSMMDLEIFQGGIISRRCGQSWWWKSGTTRLSKSIFDVGDVQITVYVIFVRFLSKIEKFERKSMLGLGIKVFIVFCTNSTFRKYEAFLPKRFEMFRNVFKTFENIFKRFQNVTKCPLTFPKHFKMLWKIYQTFRKCLKMSQRYQNVPKCPKMFQERFENVTKCHSTFQEHFKIFWNVY